MVGAEPRDKTVRERLLGRGAYTLVFNSGGDLLVSKRSSSKDCYPGQLDVVCAGVVRAGESYRETALRELEEEIGFHGGTDLEELFVFPYEDSTCRVWGCAFRATFDGPLRLQVGRDVPLAGSASRAVSRPQCCHRRRRRSSGPGGSPCTRCSSWTGRETAP